MTCPLPKVAGSEASEEQPQEVWSPTVVAATSAGATALGVGSVAFLYGRTKPAAVDHGNQDSAFDAWAQNSQLVPAGPRISRRVSGKNL